MRSLGRGRPPGFALAELVVALLVAAVVLAAAFRALDSARAVLRDQAAVIAVRQNVRTAALVLQAELRPLSPAAGDVVAASDTAISLRAARASGPVCATPSLTSATVVLRDGLLSAIRAPDPARDSVLLFREGEPLRTSDDRWIHAGLAAAHGASCADGAPGTALVLSGAAPGELAGVAEGAPARVVEPTQYRLYRDAAGQWWLGAREFTGGAWSATSPVAGPLRPRDGLRLRFLDLAGGPAPAPAAAALVEIAVRGRSARPLRAGKSVWSPFEDSLVALVAPRND